MALFKKKGTQQLVPWEESMEVNDFSISLPDLNNGSPKAGDMIATNKNNPEDKWLVAKQFFNDNYEPANPIEGIVDGSDYFGFKHAHNAEEKHETDVRANKYLRKGLDHELQRLKTCPGSRERSLAVTKIQEAVMWLGMDLKRLNEPNPYPDSYNPDNTKIAPTADGLKL